MKNQPFVAIDAVRSVTKSFASLCASSVPAGLIPSRGYDARIKPILILGTKKKTIHRYIRARKSQKY